MSDYAMTPAQRRKLSGNKITLGGYASVPGTGPAGETCSTCRYIYRKRMAKTYTKCALMVAPWTGGGGTDIRAKAPACNKWEAAQ